MAVLTHRQKKALAGYLRTWDLKPGAEISILESATDRFCDLLLLDPPWNEIWTVNDVKNLIEEARDETVRNANEQVLKNSDLLRKQIHDQLIAEIESYPREYLVYIELPGLDTDCLDKEIFDFSDEISLIRTSGPFEKIDRLVRPSLPEDAGDLLAGTTTLEEAREALRPISSFLLEQDSIYLRVRESGALPHVLVGGESLLLPHALASLKIFVFYGLEIGLFERREIFRSRQVEPEFRTTVHAAIHEINGEDQISEKLPRDFENFLRGVTFFYSEDEEEFAPIQWRKLVSDLHPIVQFLSMVRSDAHAQRIAAGIEWLIDSLVATNQTLSLIQSCIGIEAILGDSTSAPYEVGITARLSERFAYLMGTSAENRRVIRDEFRAVFAKRGDLVHARRHRLPAHDLQIVHTAQHMLQQVIRKELSLLLELPSNMLSHMNLMAIKRGMQPF